VLYWWAGAVHILNNYLACTVTCFGEHFLLEVNCLTEDPCRRELRITVPEPEMTKDNKFKCPLDQTIYDNKEDYEKHCKEEHDVL
jgi:hypothetical protein